MRQHGSRILNADGLGSENWKEMRVNVVDLLSLMIRWIRGMEAGIGPNDIKSNL